eukprot:10255023-Alexandrium_andersonii.AAC.1
MLDSEDAETGSESFGINGSIGIEHFELIDESESFGSNGSIGIEHFELIDDSIEQYMEESKEEEMLDSGDAEEAKEKDGEGGGEPKTGKTDEEETEDTS